MLAVPSAPPCRLELVAPPQVKLEVAPAERVMLFAADPAVRPLMVTVGPFDVAFTPAAPPLFVISVARLVAVAVVVAPMAYGFVPAPAVSVRVVAPFLMLIWEPDTGWAEKEPVAVASMAVAEPATPVGMTTKSLAQLGAAVMLKENFAG